MHYSGPGGGPGKQRLQEGQGRHDDGRGQGVLALERRTVSVPERGVAITSDANHVFRTARASLAQIVESSTSVKTSQRC